MATNEASPPFIPGLELSGLFHAEVVAPLLADAFPGLPYSAALIGYGSELLGYDTPRSTDHNWGPRLLLFLSEEDHAAHAAALDDLFATRLPPTFRGYSTHFGPPEPDGARLPGASPDDRIAHQIEIHPFRPLLARWLGFDPLGEIGVRDWLAVPQQRLLEVTAGRVYHDGLGLLQTARENLAWYPDQVWRYLLAAQWGRISEQEAFVGRAGEVGDEVGSALVAADLVRDLMRLGFLIERRYAPYAKWFGTAFRDLACAPRLLPFFQGALHAQTWREREAFLAPAYEIVAAMQNDLGVAPWVDPATRPYHGRPFRVLHAERFSEAIAATITDPTLRGLIERDVWFGAIDQFSDNVSFKGDAGLAQRIRALYVE